ncbi:hypothetical protein V8G54_031425 [Vigna mungo]|uniref:Uncharacterized protein n=1 Tax=Vigna mungo TaxID=3915 RepID=A0AAQ3RGW7_VIGMU
MDAAEPFNVPVNPEALGIPDGRYKAFSNVTLVSAFSGSVLHERRRREREENARMARGSFGSGGDNHAKHEGAFDVDDDGNDDHGLEGDEEEGNEEEEDEEDIEMNKGQALSVQQQKKYKVTSHARNHMLFAVDKCKLLELLESGPHSLNPKQRTNSAREKTECEGNYRLH